MKSGTGNIISKQPNGTNGWFFGNFDDNPLPYPWNYKDFQIKWADLEKDKNSDGIKPADDKTTISILVGGGPHEITLYDEQDKPETHILSNEGDFIFWGPGIKHKWIAREKNLTITFRWKN